MFNFKLLFLVIIVLVPQNGLSKISDKRLCADEKCTERISLAKTILLYNSPEKGLLSVPQNQEVTVYSKSAGSNTDLWGVEYNGKRGYLNKKFLRETRIFKKDLPYLVDTELKEFEKVPSLESVSKSEDILPNSQQTEVIDGTTIISNDINPSATQEENIKPTESVLSAVFEGFSFGLLNDEDEKDKETEPVHKDVTNNLDDSEVEDDEDEDDENVEDDEEDEDQEEEKFEKETENVSIEDDEDTENVEEQEKEETTSDSNIINKNEANNTVEIGSEDNKINLEDKLLTKGSITSRSLLQHGDNPEETISSPDNVKKEVENFEKAINADILNDSKEIPSENLENVVITTESIFDAFLDNSENIESITENPGKLDENFKDDSENTQNITKDEEKIDSIQIESVKNEENILKIENDPKNTEVKTENDVGKLDKSDNNINVVVKDIEDVEKNKNSPSEPIIQKEEAILVQVNENAENDTESIEHVNENINVITENIEQINENINVITENSGMKENISTESSIQTEENVLAQDENVENAEPLFSENVLPIDSIPENIIQKDEIVQESNDVRLPVPETPLDTVLEIPETPLNTLPEISETQKIIDHNEILSSNEHLNENSIQTNPEASNVSEDQSINITPEKVPEGVSENLELDPENKQPDSGGWYNSFFGGASNNDVANENGSDTGDEKPVIQEIVEIDPQDNIQENIEENIQENIQENVQEENIQTNNEKDEKHEHNVWTNLFHSSEEKNDASSVETLDSCPINSNDCSNFLGTIQNQLDMDLSNINFSDILNLITVLAITGITVVVFLLGYIAIDKSRRETPLVAKINKLEKALLVSTKENQILTEKFAESETELREENVISSKIYSDLEDCNRQLMDAKIILEEQVQSLEKELENSTEVGFELNRMLSEILKSQSGSDMLVANVENLQRQLVEQQSTINSINATLNLKDTENHELQLELEIKNKKVTDLQTELDKMALNLLKAEDEKDQVQSKLENEVEQMKEELSRIKASFNFNRNKFNEDVNGYKKKLTELQKAFDLKSNEYNILTENFNQIKTFKGNQDVIKDLLQSVTSKAELAELQKDNNKLNELLVQEREIKVSLEQRVEEVLKEMNAFKEKYDEVDKEKLEAQTKLEVLGNYFKEKEAELQRELAKQEALWQEKQGEATSSTERIRYIKEELQNYKSQNELLKQEIVSQEVELKSQISVLEKKAHESWLSARQAERRLEDAKQEAAQLRNRLTLKERSFLEEKGQQHRVQSPLEQNGEIIESPASPPLLYSGSHDHHLPTSPGPLPPGLPPFLPPPPPGVHAPFMPPPIPGVVPGFMPPPPSMFPVDHPHRPPPLGRMSSPPLNSRYSPDSSRYSDRYDDRNNSPSPPPYDEDDRYGPVSPPLQPRHGRPYSPYRNDRREYKRTNAGGGRLNGRNKGVSSGSDNSNSETTDRTNRHHTKI